MSLATQNGKAPAKAEKDKSFLGMLAASEGEIKKLLPPHMSVERVMRVSRSAYQMNPDIQKCDPFSILKAVMIGCELGLEAGGARKHAWLLPYGNQCTFQIGYQGILELARRSGQFSVIESVPVNEKDAFSVVRDPRPRVNHVPCLTGDPGPMTHVYAYAVLAGGELVFEVMDKATVDKIRKSSKCPNSPAWTKWYDQMACRSVLNRLLKRQPSSVELAEALDHCNSEFEGGGHVVNQVTVRPGESRAAALARSLNPPAPEPEFTEGTSGTIRTEAEPEELTAEDYGGEPNEPGSDG